MDYRRTVGKKSKYLGNGLDRWLCPLPKKVIDPAVKITE